MTYTLQSDSSLSDLYQLVGDFKDEAFLDGIVLTRETVRERQLKAIETSEAALNKSLALSGSKKRILVIFQYCLLLQSLLSLENLGRVAGDFSPLSASAANTALFDGDAIIVPKLTNVINVIGEVLNPIAFEYSERINIKSAIDKAGGYQSYADKKRVYVIKANGMVEKAGRNIFAGNSNLEPGDTIVVPRKIEYKYYS